MSFHPEIVLFSLASVLASALAVYGFLRRSDPSAAAFAWTMLCVAGWTGLYNFHIASDALEAKIFWGKAVLVFALPTASCWMAFTLLVTDHGKWLSRPVVTLLWLWPLTLLVMAYSNDFHHLYWREFALEEGRLDWILVHGPFFQLRQIPTMAMFPFGMWVTMRYYQRARPYQRTRALILFAAATVPVGLWMTRQLTGVELIPRVDQAPISLFASCVVFAIAVFGFDALDVRRLADRLVVDQIHAGVVVVDPEGRVLAVNPHAASFVRTEHPVGLPLTEALPECAALELRDGYEAEVSFRGDDRCWLTQVSQIGDDATGPMGHALMFLDITARKEAERALETLATTDPLTGAHNRRHFLEQGRIEIERASRFGSPSSVLMLDVDHFKAVNDRYGHAAGDDVLVAVVEAARRSLREVDLFGRSGGEEFVALVAGDTSAARQVAERVRTEVAAARVAAGTRTIEVTCSMGVAQVDPRGLHDAIERADAALYEAKRGGRNRVEVARPDAVRGQA